MIGICTDSYSLLPQKLQERFGIEVVPLTVTVDDLEYLEGVDLDADRFYDLYSDAHGPVATYAEPSSGQFAAAYDDLIARGCTEILSIHSTTSAIGALNAARLAAHCAPVAVRLIDSGTARFGVSCCVWSAAEAIESGATFEEAAAVAEALAPRIGNVFIMAAHQLIHATSADAGISVWTQTDGVLERLQRVGSVADAVTAMAKHALAWGDRLKLGVGTAHRDCLPIGDALFHAVGESANVIEAVQFRILPSAGIETGPGTISCVMFPA